MWKTFMEFKRSEDEESGKNIGDPINGIVDNSNSDNAPDTPGGEHQATEAGDDKSDRDKNKMGLIRRVANAHLVYKRQEEDGTYTELWLYHDDVMKSSEIRKEILAGTDIDIKTGYSEDRAQTYEIWSPGNCEMVQITGLPS